MRLQRAISSLAVVAFLASPAFAQQTSTTGSTSQAISLLQKSVAAQTGGATTTDVTLSGKVTFLGGTHPGSGTATFTALANGTSQSVFNMPSGQLTEVWTASQSAPTISATSPKGKASVPAGQSVTMPYAAWFSPTVLTALASGSNYASSYRGSEKRNGATVEHLIAWQVPEAGSTGSALMLPKQTKCDIYIDPATSLPVSAVFQVWPYHPPGKPLSIRAQPATEEVRYSDYQSVNGRVVPLHVQVYLQNTEIIDIAISSVAFNTGATITAPN